MSSSRSWTVVGAVEVEFEAIPHAAWFDDDEGDGCGTVSGTDGSSDAVDATSVLQWQRQQQAGTLSRFVLPHSPEYMCQVQVIVEDIYLPM